MKKKRIAFIVQRYGTEVNGGAEYHCRLVAEKLICLYDVEVLTSCARDYVTWANEYAPGEEIINGVRVKRFAVPFERNNEGFRSLSRKFAYRRPYLKVLKFLGLTSLYHQLIPARIKQEDALNWSKYQGPYVPELPQYIRENETAYDAFIFFTYLYYPTIAGLDICPQKSVLIPTAHDEPTIYYPLFKDLFLKPAAILYNTIAEKRFVNLQFHNEYIYSDIVGIGVEPTIAELEYNKADILKSNAPYLLYIGRIDISKGCALMFDYFLKFREDYNGPVKLVLIGQPFMEIPVHEDIISLGFVNEDLKNSVLKEAAALVIPSLYESLSMVTLESMQKGVPVLANGHCEVLKDHIELSRGGLIFTEQNSFKLAAAQLLADGPGMADMRKNAIRYVKENYSWDSVLDKFRKVIDLISP